MGAVIEAFQGVDPQALTIARREGCVLLAWEPVCLIDPAPGGIFTIKWSDATLTEYKICKQVATREFERLTAESASARRNVGSINAVVFLTHPLGPAALPSTQSALGTLGVCWPLRAR